MTDQVDRDIHDLLDRAREQAPDPLNWLEVTGKPVSARRGNGGGDPRRVPRRWLLATAASLVVVLVGGLIIATRTNRSEPALPTATTAAPFDPREDDLRPLATLTEADVVIPTSLPDGWTVAPLKFEPDRFNSFMLISPDGEAVGVSFSFPEGTLSVGPAETYELAGVEWDAPKPSEGRLLIARLGEARITVGAELVEAGVVRDLADGLRVGTLEQFPAGVFRADTDGAEVARNDAGASLRVAIIDETICNSFTIARGDAFAQCLITPLLPDRETGIEVGDGITMLQWHFFGSSDDDVTSVDLAGMVDPDIEAVELTFAGGTAVQVETEDLSGEFESRFFVVSAASVFDLVSIRVVPIEAIND